MAKFLFTNIVINNSGENMKTIIDQNNFVVFNAKPKKTLIRKTKQIAAIAAGFATFNLSKSSKKDSFETKAKKSVNEEYSIPMREALIKSKIQENIEKKKTISVKSIANELNIPLHLVITSLYRTKSSVRSLFEKVKNTSYLKKPTSDTNKNAAQNIINASKNYLTTNSALNVEDSYINTLGRKLDKLNFSPEEIEELTNLYKMKPALADAILFSRSKSKSSGLITPNTMKSIVAAHEINQELTEEIIYEKKPSGVSYALRDVYKIVKINQMSEKLLEPAKEDATTVYEFITARMKNGKPRFGAEDILQILKSLKENPEFTNYALNQKNGNLGYRFNGHQLRLVLKTYEKYPYLVSSLIKSQHKISPTQIEYKYSSYCIERILEALNGDDTEKIELVMNLLRDENIDKRKPTPSAAILAELEEYDRKNS